MYPVIDFGVNYAGHRYTHEQILERVENSSLNGVDKIVSISNNIDECIRNIQLSQNIKQLYFTLGVHPHNAKKFKKSDLLFLEKQLSNKKCFGLGEIGLDFNRNYSSKSEQIYAFKNQLLLAKNKGVKVYLHCRDAYKEFIQIIKEINYYNGIVHCFTGTLEQALELTLLGFKLGITGWLLDKRRNASLVEVIQNEQITLEMLLVETDAPFMCPVKKKKRINIKRCIFCCERNIKTKKH